MIHCLIWSPGEEYKPCFYFKQESETLTLVTFPPDSSLRIVDSIFSDSEIESSTQQTFQPLTPDQEILYHLQSYEALTTSLLQAQPL